MVGTMSGPNNVDSGTPVEPLRIHDKCQVHWRGGSQILDAVVVERRPLKRKKQNKGRKRKEPSRSSDSQPAEAIDSLPADEIEYYVHYIKHDRRLDEWLTLDNFDLGTLERHVDGATNNDDAGVLAEASSGNLQELEAAPDRPQRPLHRRRSSGSLQASSQQQMNSNGIHNSSNNLVADESQEDLAPFSLSGGNWHGSSSGDPTLAAYEREHEETTKVKNIEEVVMGNWKVEAWYYSPFPEPYSQLKTLYVCEYCLAYMRKLKTYKAHRAECSCRHPPGREIYREDDLVVYELDGRDHRLFCQRLCLLAKLFLDHKTLYYDVTPFYFMVVARIDERGGAHIVGYFSKEKVSSEGYNLACILTFPQFQKSGYGKFIISLSYEMTKREGKTGSPEKPLSDLGKVSYRSYWTHVLMNLLNDFDTRKGSGGGGSSKLKDISIQELSQQTGIKTEDIISTLQSLDMIKVWKGQHVVYVEQEKIKAYMELKKQFRLCKPECLDWTPHPANK